MLLYTSHEMQFFSETKPELVKKSNRPSHETNHPKMPLILEYLLASDQYETCWEVITYSRDIYGERDLYPLDLVFQPTH